MSAEQKPFVQTEDLRKGRVDWYQLRANVYSYYYKSAAHHDGKGGTYDEIHSTSNVLLSHYPFELYIDELVNPEVLEPTTLGSIISTIRHQGENGRKFAEALALRYLCKENGSMTVDVYRDTLYRARYRKTIRGMLDHEEPSAKQPDEDVLNKARIIETIIRTPKYCDLMLHVLMLHSNLMKTEVPEKIELENPEKAGALRDQLESERERSAALLREMTMAATSEDINYLPAQMASWNKEYNDILSGFRSLLERIAACFKSVFSSSPTSCNLAFFKHKEIRSGGTDISEPPSPPKDDADAPVITQVAPC